MTTVLYKKLENTRNELLKAYNSLPSNYGAGNKKLYTDAMNAIGRLMFIEQ